MACRCNERAAAIRAAVTATANRDLAAAGRHLRFTGASLAQDLRRDPGALARAAAARLAALRRDGLRR